MYRSLDLLHMQLIDRGQARPGMNVCAGTLIRTLFVASCSSSTLATPLSALSTSPALTYRGALLHDLICAAIFLIHAGVLLTKKHRYSAFEQSDFSLVPLPSSILPYVNQACSQAVPFTHMLHLKQG